MISLCNNWEFTENWSEAFAMGEGSGETVRLPHTVRQKPLPSPTDISVTLNRNQLQSEWVLLYNETDR